jgi:flagellar basal body-associated protein FliL
MKFSRIYSDVQDKVSSVIFAKRIAEEEQRRKTTLLIVLISVGVAIVAAAAAVAIYCASKTEDGQCRGKVLVEKVKSKLPKKAECCNCEEVAEEACECCDCEEAVEEAAEAEVVEE